MYGNIHLMTRPARRRYHPVPGQTVTASKPIGPPTIAIVTKIPSQNGILETRKERKKQGTKLTEAHQLFHSPAIQRARRLVPSTVDLESPKPSDYHISGQRSKQPDAEDVKDGLLARLHPSQLPIGSGRRSVHGIPPGETEGGAPQVDVDERVGEGGMVVVVGVVMILLVGEEEGSGDGGGVCKQDGCQSGVKFNEHKNFGGGRLLLVCGLGLHFWCLELGKKESWVSGC